MKAPRLSSTVQVVVNTLLTDLKNERGIHFNGKSTSEDLKVDFPNEAGEDGVFSITPKRKNIKRGGYLRLCGMERRVNGQDNKSAYATVFCLPTGEPLRPFKWNKEKGWAIFATKHLISMFANEDALVSIKEEWTDSDSVYCKPLFIKKISAFFEGKTGKEFEEQITSVLGEDLKQYTQAVCHALLKASGDTNGHYPLFVDLSKSSKVAPPPKDAETQKETEKKDAPQKPESKKTTTKPRKKKATK